MDYGLTVTIDTALLPILIDGNYKLCIAKKVNDKYTVVWQGSSVLPTNSFEWSSKFQAYGTAAFKSGARVSIATNKENIASGQTAVLDKYGIMHHAAGTTDKSGTFTIDNQFGLINIGLDGLVNGSYAPVYVSPNPLVSGPTKLQPIEKVMVWFDTALTTGTMLLDASSEAIEVDFTTVSTHTLSYRIPNGGNAGQGVWYLDDNQLVLPMTYNLQANSFAIPEPSDAVLRLMSELLNERSTRPKFTTPVTATAEFETERAASEFEEHARTHAPAGFERWQARKEGHAVSLTMQVQVAADEEASVRTATDAYLQVLYSFPGPKYTKLITTVNGRPYEQAAANGVNGETHDEKATGTAAVNFRHAHDAAAFSAQVNGATYHGVKLEADERGTFVSIKFCAKERGEDVHDRVRRAYDAALEAFQGTPPVYVGQIVWE